MTIIEAAKKAAIINGGITRAAWEEIGISCRVYPSNLKYGMILIIDTGETVLNWSPQFNDICANDWIVEGQIFNIPYPCAK